MADVRTLVAGVGNIFLRDDGFGSEVARRMVGDVVPDGVRVVDYGIGGIHLAYDLLDGVDLLILIDAFPHDVESGTLTVLEVDESGLRATGVDSHAMDPTAVLANVSSLGGTIPRTLVLGCQPCDVSDGMGLTPAVRASVDHAAALVHQLIAEHHPAEREPTIHEERTLHEMGMCQAVLDAVERHAGTRRVERVGVRVGDELEVVPDVFEQGFQVLAEGGVAEGATTEVETTEGDELLLLWIRYVDPD